MPRRPVKPQDRQRVVRACDSCKASKKRCDGMQPCNACEKKGHNDLCRYTAGRRHHPLPRHSPISSQQPPMAHSGSFSSRNITSGGLISPNSSWGMQDPGVISPGSINTNYANAFEQRGSEESLDNDTRDSSSESMGQPPVMLSSMSGEKGQYRFICSVEEYDHFRA